MPDAKQDTLHEAADDHGLTFTVNSRDCGRPGDIRRIVVTKIRSGLDLGISALGTLAAGAGAMVSANKLKGLREGMSTSAFDLGK